MTEPDPGSFFSSRIRTFRSAVFAAPPWVCSALCGFPVLHVYRFGEGNCFPEAVSALGNKTGEGLLWGAGSERGHGRDAEQRSVPGAGRSPGSLPGCCGRSRVGEAPEQLGCCSGPGPFAVPEVASEIRQRQSQRRQRGWKGRGRGRGKVWGVSVRSCCRDVLLMGGSYYVTLGTLKVNLFCNQ